MARTIRLSSGAVVTLAPKPMPKPEFEAKTILASDHPLHGMFTRWVAQRNKEHKREAPPTVRQARKFLAAHPQFKQAKAA